MKRKLLTILLASVCAMSLLAGCGDTDSSKDEDTRTEDVDEEDDMDEEDVDDEDDEDDEMTEEDKVAADTQRCDDIRTAIQITLMDPAIVTDSEYKDVTSDGPVTYSSLEELCAKAEFPAFRQHISDLLYMSGNLDDISKEFMSSGARGQNVSIYIEANGTNIVVYIPGTDASANEGSYPCPNTNKEESCIYSGVLTPTVDATAVDNATTGDATGEDVFE